ncbi:uncharacterized protein MONBRDRAFT_27727 [Monosiga brevicollis MX1]|uniref:J domain-containing protein n=1 Tax=Monosiga brevicollis TaxID=81824 RepID=A9V649_MONBE|nr:uncharacterized protein MONBRDRAFT_27727 [Monosiga brevicollis MX1]EDQ87008.1 predicted protein [Monosiga brevicollis MX1]|eukprot:XP_001748247.1 hypothetical protein [Monosiga brevicollis MX1]
MADHDLYQLLGVDPNASASELRKAYLREARTHHPDKAGANPKADDDRFFHLKRAYDILSHPVRRLVYDKREYTTIQLLHTSPLFDADDFFEQHPWLRPGPAETTLASPQSGVSSSSSSTSSSSSSFVQAPAPRESPPSPRERDVPSPDITTIDASTTTALADSPAPSSRPHTTDSPTKLAPSSPKSQSSPTANDSGAPITLATRRDSQNSPGQAPPANHPVDASHRKTELWLDLEDRLFPSVKEVSVSRTVLPKHGPRREETILLTVDVQPHWEHGTVVTFGGAGDVVEDGSHEFDYHVHICFRPHPIYTCQGSDLLAVAKVSLWGALYGCTTVLPLPDGTEHLIPLDSVAPDTKYRIPGAGLRKASTTEPDRVSRPASERALEKPHALRGDIWVEFVIDTPEAPAELPFSKCTYPTHWTAIPVACERCQRRHCSGEVDTCKFHPGALLAEITLDAGPAPPATLTACSPQANAMLRRQNTTHIQSQWRARTPSLRTIG